MTNNNDKLGLYFDSLNHATILRDGGVERPDIYTRALMVAMSQNVFNVNSG